MDARSEFEAARVLRGSPPDANTHPTSASVNSKYALSSESLISPLLHTTQKELRDVFHSGRYDRTGLDTRHRELLKVRSRIHSTPSALTRDEVKQVDPERFRG